MSVFMLIVIGLAFYSIAQNVEQSKKSMIMPIMPSDEPVAAQPRELQG